MRRLSSTCRHDNRLLRYALDSTTIDLCLSVFPWAAFRKNKGAIKLHTLLDLNGNIPTFIHISDGKLHEVSALDLISLRKSEKGDGFNFMMLDNSGPHLLVTICHCNDVYEW